MTHNFTSDGILTCTTRCVLPQFKSYFFPRYPDSPLFVSSCSGSLTLTHAWKRRSSRMQLRAVSFGYRFTSIFMFIVLFFARFARASKQRISSGKFSGEKFADFNYYWVDFDLLFRTVEVFHFHKKLIFIYWI